jgi:hypothetical protein
VGISAAAAAARAEVLRRGWWDGGYVHRIGGGGHRGQRINGGALPTALVMQRRICAENGRLVGASKKIPAQPCRRATSRKIDQSLPRW